MTRALLAFAVLLAAVSAEARPYRAMVTRTAHRVPNGMMELGLRYQGFVGGSGRPNSRGFVSAQPYHQLAGSARWYIIPRLEAEVQFEALLVRDPFGPGGAVYFGDIPLGVQFTFFDTQKFGLGLFGRLTLPTGPSGFDVVPPSLSDGSLDGEGTLVAELRPSNRFRLLVNLGYLHHGVRPNSSPPNFDLPDALRYDVGLAFNIGDKLLLALEFIGRYYFDEDITPVWNDNEHHLEAMPGIRYEVMPMLVLEASAGIAITRELREIYQWRALLGLTYEFTL